jgi:hypothetical protein
MIMGLARLAMPQPIPMKRKKYRGKAIFLARVNRRLQE